ncbi:MAG TPA: LON peptidase substrate-binding domain-containing protein, partial [Gemmataceae bacterium]|nr:LON peptidase substrate-binding domain-containing protein [Gemmataceae bacterium]
MADAHPVSPAGTVLTLPVLPLKNTTIFPYIFAPLSVGRPSSLAAVEAALASEDKTFVAVAQRGEAADQPMADLYTIGTRVVVKKMARSEDTVELIVQGVERVHILRLEQIEPFPKARVQVMPVPEDGGTEVEALHRAVIELAAKALQLAQPQGQINIEQIVAQAGDPLRLAYLIGSMLSLDVQKEQALLEANTRVEALRLLHGYLQHEVQVLELRSQIASRAQTELTKEQRDYVLRQQLRAIQEELGDKNPEKAEVEELRKRLTEADVPDDVRKEAERELGRLERMPAAAPDYQLTRTYLELVLELPWKKATIDVIDLNRARTVLDEDHFDLSE